MDYADFIQRKQRVWIGLGIDPRAVDIPDVLYPWQIALVRWALKKGRAAIFADCGLGKTFMQVAWAEALNVPTLILAPLCVAEQTVAEAAKLGIGVYYAADHSQAHGRRIVITNYERLEKFDASAFSAVVLDESRVDDGHRACADCRWRKKLRAAGIQPPLKKRQLAMATASPTNAVRR